jgi:hypothetical protein
MCVLDVRVVVRDDGGARRIARRVAERELNHARGALARGGRSGRDAAWPGDRARCRRGPGFAFVASG